jgi:hypothetical protein
VLSARQYLPTTGLVTRRFLVTLSTKDTLMPFKTNCNPCTTHLKVVTTKPKTQLFVINTTTMMVMMMMMMMMIEVAMTHGLF